MESDSNIPSPKDLPAAGRVPPLIGPSSAVAESALPPPPQPADKSSSVRPLLAILLSLGLGLFLADAVVSLIDESLIRLLDVHLLIWLRMPLSLCTMLLALVIYGLMGLTPMIPKRLFLPLALFIPVATLVAIPFLVYSYSRIHQVAWGIAFCQVILGLIILYRVQGGRKFRWPLVPAPQLGDRRFSWRNLSVFLLVNVVVLVPALIVYLGLCAVLAVNHFSDGFLALRPSGFTVEVRKYIRADGKTIQLVPMLHIGEPEFYQTLAQSFPTNALILMEGVTDNRNLLTNKITYERMAATLGVAEQHEEFKPRGELVPADVDVAEFTPNTLAGLNLVMLLHARGMNPETLIKLLQFSPPHFEEQLFDDLLRKRNRHLMGEIQTRLLQSENLIVPWGAAHMPEIAQEIQKAGFRVDETQDYVAIRFRATGNKSKGAEIGGHSEKLK